MWCGRCQQDVPGISSQQQICCARCGEKLSSGYAATAVAESKRQQGETERPKTSASRIEVDAAPPVDFDNWRLEEDLRSAARLVESLRSSGRLHRESTDDGTPLLFDREHAALPAWHSPASPGPAAMAAKPDPPPRPKRRTSFFSWTMLSLGLMTFVCGGVLLGWSFVSGRSELWSLGMPLVLVGQAALIVGLVFQLDGLWQSNRETSQTLDDLDHQLHDLKHATTMLGTTHSSGARSFYAHLAEGAPPQMLLTDLKGQMDLLALRLAQQQQKR